MKTLWKKFYNWLSGRSESSCPSDCRCGACIIIRHSNAFTPDRFYMDSRGQTHYVPEHHSVRDWGVRVEETIAALRHREEVIRQQRMQEIANAGNQYYYQQGMIPGQFYYRVDGITTTPIEFRETMTEQPRIRKPIKRNLPDWF